MCQQGTDAVKWTAETEETRGADVEPWRGLSVSIDVYAPQFCPA